MLSQVARIGWSCAIHARHVRWPLQARLQPHPRHLSTLESRSRTLNGTSDKTLPSPPPAQQGRRIGFQPLDSQKGRRAHREHNTTAPSTGSSKWTLPADRLRRHLPILRRLVKRRGGNIQSLVARFKEWDAHFSALWARLEGQTTDEPDVPAFSAINAPACGWLKNLLPHETVADMRACWLTIPAADRKRYWPQIMLATMHFHPDRTAQVLEATFKKEVVSVALDWEVTDVICFIARWTSQLPESDRRTREAALPGLVLYFLRNTPPKWLQLHQWVLGQAISVCNASTAAELCEALEKNSHELHFNTKLKLAHRLSKEREYTLMALRLLKSVISKDGLSANDRRCAALATSLLQLPPTWGEGRAPLVEMTLIAEVFEQLVGLGFSPNPITSTGLIRSLCLADQLDTAFKVYDVMRGQWSDYRVFPYLLSGAARTGSLEAVIRVLQDAPVKVLEKRDVWHEVIHTIHSAAKKEAKIKRYKYADGNPAFHSMLRVYCKFFDLAPLQRLIPLNLHRYLEEGDRNRNIERWDWEAKLAVFVDRLPILPRGEAVAPSIRTLGTMLLGYARSFPQTRRAMEFYSHFRKLLREGDSTAIRLLRQTTLPYDIVLKSLSERTGMLRVMTDIVRDMLKDATSSVLTLRREAKPATVAKTVSSGLERQATFEDAVREEIDDNKPEERNQDLDKQDDTVFPQQLELKEPTIVPFYHPPPSVCSWSILLYAFSRERGARNAARILDLMRENGIQPNRVTWNTVASGYGRTQDSKRLAGALYLLEADGYHPDRHTVRAVAKLRQYQDILDQMEDRMEQRGVAHLEKVAGLAVPPVSLIKQKRQERKRRRTQRRAAASGLPDGQQQLQQQEEEGGLGHAHDAAAKENAAADADLEASLQELEDAHDAMLRAAEEAARANPVSKTVPSAVRAVKKKSAKTAFDTQSEEVAAYMEMYDELVFAQMKEELTGFHADAGDNKTQMTKMVVSASSEAVEGEALEEGKRDGLKEGEVEAVQTETDLRNVSNDIKVEPQETERDTCNEEIKEQHSVEPVEPSEPPEPVEHVGAVNPVEPTESVESSAPVEPAEEREKTDGEAVEPEVSVVAPSEDSTTQAPERQELPDTATERTSNNEADSSHPPTVTDGGETGQGAAPPSKE